MNWLVFKKSTKNVILVCLDEELEGFVRRELFWECFGLRGGGPSKLDKDSVKSLWVTRVEHLRELLRSGLDVVVSDIDAVWKVDAVQSGLLGANTGDIVASRASFPYDSPWGAALCMGVAYFKSTRAVMDVIDLGLEETIAVSDDQVGFNHVLARFPFVDPKGTQKAFGRRISPYGDTSVSTVLLVGKLELKLVLIPHNVVPRFCGYVTKENWVGSVQIAHCHVNDGKPAPTNKHKGNQDTHMAILIKYGLFILPKDWELQLRLALRENNNDLDSSLGEMSSRFAGGTIFGGGDSP